MDLDSLVHRDDLDKLHARLTGLGYERLMRTENVSHYRHPAEAWGGVDFIHAFREISLAMLARAKRYKVFGGKQTIRVANPEDVIGLKVQAMVNDPDRKAQEVADIEMLMRLYGAKLDWQRIEDFLAESASKYHRITKHIRVTKGDGRWHRAYGVSSIRHTAKRAISHKQRLADVLSDKEKQEMKELAASKAVREEFRLLRRHSLKRRSADLDQYIRFLTTMSRLISKPARSKAFVEYKFVKL